MIGNPRQPAGDGPTTASGSGNPPLALWFRPEAVVLMLRDVAGAWTEQLEIALDAEGKAPDARALLERARLVGPSASGSPAVALWLPEEHVVRLSIDLPEDAEPATRLEAAIAAVVAQTGQPAEELALSIGAAEPGQRSRPVVGAFAQTAREARNYAEIWGFHPEAVTAAPGLDGSYAPAGRLRSLLDIPTLRARAAATVAPSTLAAERPAAAQRPARKAPGAVAICAALGAVGAMAVVLGVDFRDRGETPTIELATEATPDTAAETEPEQPQAAAKPKSDREEAPAKATDDTAIAAAPQTPTPTPTPQPALSATPPVAVEAPTLNLPEATDAAAPTTGLAEDAAAPAIQARASAPLTGLSPPPTPSLPNAPTPRVEEEEPLLAAPLSDTLPPDTPPADAAAVDTAEGAVPDLTEKTAPSTPEDQPQAQEPVLGAFSLDPGTALSPVLIADVPRPVTKAILGDARGAGALPVLEPAVEGAQTQPALIVIRSASSAVPVALPESRSLTATLSAKVYEAPEPGRTPLPEALEDPFSPPEEAPRDMLGGALIAAIDALDLALPDILGRPEDEAENAPPSELAPERLDYLPRARPSDDTVAALPETATDAVPLPPEQPTPTPEAVDVAAPVETEEAAEDVPPSPLAVARAPTPEIRPDEIPPVQRGNVVRLGAESEAAGPRVARVKPPEARQPLESLPLRLPTRVPRSGGDGRLALDEMALIGVLDLDTGRKALLRLPNGRYRRIGIGDEVEGWRVMSISGESMRIGRAGAERVLALVAR